MEIPNRTYHQDPQRLANDNDKDEIGQILAHDGRGHAIAKRINHPGKRHGKTNGKYVGARQTARRIFLCVGAKGASAGNGLHPRRDGRPKGDPQQPYEFAVNPCRGWVCMRRGRGQRQPSPK
jgi:hypothetical protein